MIRTLLQCENMMKTTFAITCVAVGTLLGNAVAMAAEHLTSLQRIHVETDTDGVVWLSGSASTREAADKAASLAHDPDGVRRVHSHIKVARNE
jgi:hypothetical protein